MSDQAVHRVKLWLKSEQALGAGRALHVAASPSPDSSEPDEALPQVAPSPASDAASPAGANLFGVVERAAPGLAPPPSVEPFSAPPLSSEQKRQRLVALDDKEVRGCTRCRLSEQRRNTVFGEGDVDAQIFFIGEGPGETEDQLGRPFVGRAGQLLDKMIGAMGLKREQVYIANIVKCRPPGNRTPAPDEVATCTPYLERQLEIIRPKVIVTLGLPATQYMLQTKTSMGRMRGQWQSWRGIKLMPTFHPAYVLRNPTYETRAAVWNDLQLVLVELGLPVPAKKKEISG